MPAVLHYYSRFVPGADNDGIVRFLLTAAAIGIGIGTARPSPVSPAIQ